MNSKRQEVMRASGKILLFVIFYAFLLSTVSAKTFFLGKVIETVPRLNIIVVKGEPLSNVQKGQVYDVALGNEIYAKAKVTFVGEESFDAKIIDGSTREIYEIMNGEGEIVASDGTGFLVLGVEDPQKAVLVFKSGKIKKVVIEEQTLGSFKVRDEKNRVFNISPKDLRVIHYFEEADYRKYVKEETLVADVVPGERERKKAKIAAIKLKRRFSEALRLSIGFINSNQFIKALKKAEEAILIKPNFFQGYLVKGRALLGKKNSTFAIAMFEKAIKLDKGNKNLGEIEFYISQAYREMGNLKEAKRYLEQSVDHGRDDLASTQLLADIQLEAGRFNEALSTITWSLRKNKKGTKELRSKLHVMAGVLYFEKQMELEKAEKQAKLALALVAGNKKAKKLLNSILLERSKKQEKEKVDISIIGGGWRSPNNKLYISFFEEKITILIFRKNPISKKTEAIIIGGDMGMDQDEELFTVTSPLTQRFPVGKIKQLKYSQIQQLSEAFFGGDEEVNEMDAEIAFKINSFSPLKMNILLDGRKFKMVPMDMEE